MTKRRISILTYNLTIGVWTQIPVVFITTGISFRFAELYQCLVYSPGYLIHEDQVYPNKESQDKKLSDNLSDNWNLFVNILYILVNMLNMD